jgi:hypothetical protein
MRRQSELSIRAQITVGRTSVGQRSSILGLGGQSSYHHGAQYGGYQQQHRASPSMGLTVFNYSGPDSVFDRPTTYGYGYRSPRAAPGYSSSPARSTYLSSATSGEFLRPGAYLASTASPYGRMTAARRYEAAQPSSVTRTRVHQHVQPASASSYASYYQQASPLERQTAEGGRQQRTYRSVLDDDETRRTRGSQQGTRNDCIYHSKRLRDYVITIELDIYILFLFVFFFLSVS